MAKNLKNFINFLVNYVLLRNVKCKVLLTEAHLEPSRTSTMELFSLQLSHILKKYILNLIKLPIGSIFYTTHHFVKKPTTLKTLGEKELLLIELFFFSDFKITQWNDIINKGFLN